MAADVVLTSEFLMRSGCDVGRPELVEPLALALARASGLLLDHLKWVLALLRRDVFITAASCSSSSFYEESALK